MDKSISIKNKKDLKNITIEKRSKIIEKMNLWVNRITLVYPGIILLIDLILKVNGKEDTSLYKLIFQLVTPIFIIVPIYMLIKLHGLILNKQQETNDTIDIPRKAISRYGRAIWNDARANIDYTKGITVLLEHGFDTLSQKLFASLVTLTATLAAVERGATACLIYLLIILGPYLFSFWSIEQIKQNKKERKMSEYLLLTISVFINLLAFILYFILVMVVYFSSMSTEVFFWLCLLLSIGLILFIGYDYYGLIQSIKLRSEEGSKKQENQ